MRCASSLSVTIPATTIAHPMSSVSVKHLTTQSSSPSISLCTRMHSLIRSTTISTRSPCLPSPRLTLRVRVVAHDTQNQTLPSRCRASYASGLRPFDDVTDVSKVESKERTTQIDHPGQGYVGESLGVSTGKPALL